MRVPDVLPTVPASAASADASAVPSADSPITLIPEPLSAAAFAPYGEVIDLLSDARRAYATRAFEHDATPGAPSMWIGYPPGVANPPDGILRLKKLERHPHATQTFVPIEAGRYLIVVCAAAADGSPDLATLRALIGDEKQAITYGQNVWHHGLTVLDARTRFVTVMASYRTGDDDVFLDLPAAVDVLLPTPTAQESAHGNA